MPLEIPLPIQFNAYKHHFRFLLKELAYWQKSEWAVAEAALHFIGDNLFDFYIGNLSGEEVCNTSFNYFKTKHIVTKKAFVNWLGNSQWKKIMLPDESEWLVKKGYQHDRYIHIHPAKFSKHTIRVRATTLKTVLTLCVHKIPLHKNNAHNLRAINQQRVSFIKLSPIKWICDENSAIIKLWQLFANSGVVY